MTIDSDGTCEPKSKTASINQEPTAGLVLEIDVLVRGRTRSISQMSRLPERRESCRDVAVSKKSSIERTPVVDHVSKEVTRK